MFDRDAGAYREDVSDCALPVGRVVARAQLTQGGCPRLGKVNIDRASSRFAQPRRAVLPEHLIPKLIAKFFKGFQLELSDYAINLS